jgi:hypothetical protein
MAASIYLLPVRIEVQDPVRGLKTFQQGYDNITQSGSGREFTGKGTIAIGKVRFVFHDHWRTKRSGLIIDRVVSVVGNGNGGFMSALVFSPATKWKRDDVTEFMPGIVYGSTDNLPKMGLVTKASYLNHHGIVRVREDRLSAPLFGVRFNDGSAVTLSDDNPKAGSTVADSTDAWEENVMREIVDARFSFGALGEDETDASDVSIRDQSAEPSGTPKANRLPEIGFWMPGTEGELTNGFGLGAETCCWRRRFHPQIDGLTQRYRLSIDIDEPKSFAHYARDAWRRSWVTLHPEPAAIDIEAVRQSIESMLERVVVHGKRATGFPFFIDSVRGEQLPDTRFALMGFLGRNLQIADMFLYESTKARPNSRTLRETAEQILDSFASLRMSPPESDGLWLDSGRPVDNDVYLRSMCEDLFYMLSAWHREIILGREHSTWRERPIEFADWLLRQKNAGGGFPRAWQRNSNVVIDSSELSSYFAVPLLVEVFEVTHNRRYLDAAIRAGEVSWKQGQADWRFYGGTNDHPNMLDKEAGTWSLNAYLTLYEATHEPQWLERAKVAGDYSETYIYAWNVDMPSDATNADLPWKKGASTVGLNLVEASGTGQADEYMSGDVLSYAKLYKYTGDRHYLSVARILLRNTKAMMALPGRTYDLVGPGWQQEGWFLSIPKNYMTHRVWLPWISAAQLAGIVETEEFDPTIFHLLLESQKLNS